MTLQLCKDFLAVSKNNATISTQYYDLYITAIFLRAVCGFTTVGQTNFNIDGSAITISTGTTNANLNLGGSLALAFQVPTMSHTVSYLDVGRILAVKSYTNPMLSSGLFRVSGIDTVSNSFILTPRSWLNSPAVEIGLSWTLFENEDTVISTFLNGGNSNPSNQYHGNGTATTSRIILQSPSYTGWQVRICAEVPNDWYGNSYYGNYGQAATSFAPGFNGNSAGDFAPGGQHLHVPLFYNLVDQSGNSPNWLATSLPGLSANTNNSDPPARYYMWCDDFTGTAFIIRRSHGGSLQSLVTFGLPEDEELPLADNAHRIFTYGATQTGMSSLFVSTNLSTQMGVAFGLGNQPVIVSAGSWCYLQGQGDDGGIMTSGDAADNTMLGATELETWDLYAGAWDSTTNVNNIPAYSLEPRRLGRLPFARHGRQNYNPFSTSTDSYRSWFYVNSGIYMPWLGPIVP